MRTTARTVIALMVGAVVALSGSSASAHESREVGDYEFVVGWYDEPAFAYQKNGPEVIITDLQGNAIEEGVDLQIDITFEGKTMTAELEPSFSEPNNYQADLYPTRAGTWEFRVFGTVEGQEVDETFTSGPETFSDIEDPGEVAFPVDDPSLAELSDQVEQLSAQSGTGEEGSATDEAASARTLAYVGIGAGLLGLIVAIVALTRRRAAA